MGGSTEIIRRLEDSVGRALVGKPEVVRLAVIGLVARGHLLIEDVPGVGKTTLASALARSIGASFQRIQFTSDMLPSDVLGVSVWDPKTGDFVFKPGPLFTNIVLADEINRTTPKTQSALLEAMAERQVTIDRTTHRLSPGFLVIATQNPREFEGTYPLPESQLDRFMMRVNLGYPSVEDEAEVLNRYGTMAATGDAAPERSPPPPIITADQLEAARQTVDQVHVSAEVNAYILAIAKASRENPHISLGLSTRGALALLRAARVAASMRDSDFVTPDDVKLVAPWTIPHRLALSSEAALERRNDVAIVRALLERVPVPR